MWSLPWISLQPGSPYIAMVPTVAQRTLARWAKQRVFPSATTHPVRATLCHPITGGTLKEGLCWQWTCPWTSDLHSWIFSDTCVNVKLACLLSPCSQIKRNRKNKAYSTGDNRLHTRALAHDSRGPCLSCNQIGRIFLDVSPVDTWLLLLVIKTGANSSQWNIYQRFNAHQMLLYATYTGVDIRWKHGSVPWVLWERLSILHSNYFLSCHTSYGEQDKCARHDHSSSRSL